MGDSAPDILAIFSEAVAFESAEARKEYLDGVCGDDQKARQKVETLMRAHFDAGNFLGGRSLYRTASYVPPVMEQPGDQIGSYKLLQQIGEGGFGVVYMAEQFEPVRRKVALKIIKPGMDSKQVVARFEAERQALALMTHPNIAQVFDGGLTNSGRPYFVMELVRGVPLTEFCDDEDLSVKKRLELFVTVCRAIHHAHQKGVIHRDIKPSNVMVTLHDGEPVVKVIDFGISKAIGQQLTEKTMFTAYGQMIGTPTYMSPEQAETSGLDTDIRSDIYSLGVLLYELLTGTTPLEREKIESAGLAELQRMVREEEAPRPSTRLSSLAETAATRADRGTNFKQLLKLVRGDLDWIVMKSLEKDRNRRYETALSFAEDVERFLRQEPIEARPPSAVYRLRKFIRRNRVALSWVGTIAVLALTLIVVVDTVLRSQDREKGLTEELRGKTAEVRLKDTEAERQKWARNSLPQIAELKEREQVVSAFKLAREVQQVLPGDPAFLSLWEELTVDTTVDSDPPGARVSIRDWDAVDGEWLEIGTTPLTDFRLPAGPVRFRFEKEGFTSREAQRSLPGSPWTHLSPETESPEMVGIPPLTINDEDGKRTLSPFRIDRFEVTNRDYQAFVDAGGYENREYWKEPFVSERGGPISWEDAMKEFVDETGHRGPKPWRNGRYPDGEGDYPVRGVSWYEAMAYARFANKWLPTIHHWSWASYGKNEYFRPLSNLNGRGPEPVGHNQGIGVFGVYDMGGNVKEWCFNQYGEHHRMLSGADWRTLSYMLRSRDHAAPMKRDETYGFRCVRYYDSKEIQWSFRRQDVEEEPSQIPSATDEEIQEYLRLFEYDRNFPLNDTLLTRDLAPDDHELRHEIIQLDTAYGEERFDVHLLIPRRGAAPLQTIVWFPGIGSMQKQSLEEYQTRREFDYVRALAMTGRIVCLPVYKGTFDRAHAAPIRSMRDWRVQLVKDLSRTIDYLETRSDLDHETLVYVGLSMGASFAPCHLVAEPRLKSAVLIAAGPGADKPPEGSSMRYAAHVKVPVLILNGRFDTRFPYQEEQLPFFERLGSADKHLEEFPSGHAPPVDDAVRVADKWLRNRAAVEGN